jgi:hypothetical protein
MRALLLLLLLFQLYVDTRVASEITPRNRLKQGRGIAQLTRAYLTRTGTPL